jgi:hypothetical protein
MRCIEEMIISAFFKKIKISNFLFIIYDFYAICDPVFFMFFSIVEVRKNNPQGLLLSKVHCR